MEIKLELDTEKTANAVVTVTAILGLCWVFECSKNHFLASENALTIIIVISIIHSPWSV